MFRRMVQICKIVCTAAALVQMQNELGRCDCLWRTRSGLPTSGFAGLCWYGCNSSGLEMVPKFNTVRTHHPALRHFNNTQQKIKKHVSSHGRIHFFAACQASWSFVSLRKIYDCNVVIRYIPYDSRFAYAYALLMLMYLVNPSSWSTEDFCFESLGPSPTLFSFIFPQKHVFRNDSLFYSSVHVLAVCACKWKRIPFHRHCNTTVIELNFRYIRKTFHYNGSHKRNQKQKKLTSVKWSKGIQPPRIYKSLNLSAVCVLQEGITSWKN